MPPENVNKRIYDICLRKGSVSSTELAKALRVSRQAAHRKLQAGVESGALVTEGAARSTRYRLSVPVFRFAVEGSSEDRIFKAVVLKVPTYGTLSSDEQRIVAYAFSEMVNNALDHSRGKWLLVRLWIERSAIRLIVEDDGIGTFESVRASRTLASVVEAAAEITKGRVTTMPSRHRGEGIFFTSRVVERFELAANGIQLVVDASLEDIAVLQADHARGTKVDLKIGRPPKQTIEEVFNAYTENYEFVKTRTVVKLFGLGKDFVSRSEARRLLHGLEAFREVVVDFDSVRGIGQAFADEIFRVFQNDHPEIRLVPVHMNAPVRFFVERALRARRGDDGPR